MNFPYSKSGGWNNLPPSNQNFWEEILDESEPWLLIGIPNRDPFFVTQHLERHSASSDQHMKKLMLLREGLHILMKGADRYWLNIQEDMHRGENAR